MLWNFRGGGGRGRNKCHTNSAGMKNMRDFHSNVALFDFYGTPAAIVFQTAKGYLL